MLRDIFLNFYTIEDKASMLTVSFEALTAILMVQYHLNLHCFTIIIHDYNLQVQIEMAQNFVRV